MRGFRRTLFFSHLGLVVLTILLLLVTFRGLATRYFAEQLRDRLLSNAAWASRTIKPKITDDGFDIYLTQTDLRALQKTLRSYARENHIRLVVVSRDLQVLSDSGSPRRKWNSSATDNAVSSTQSTDATSSDSTTPDNATISDGEIDDPEVAWSARAEVVAAMQGETISVVKGSWRDTSSSMTLAMPIRLHANGEVVGCVIASSSILVLTPILLGLARSFFLFVAAILLLVAALSFALAQRLASPVRRLETATRRLADGDLSSRVLMHRRFLGRGDELDRLTHEFNAMAEKLELVDLERRAFLADVSHELRTPLTAIKGSAETLRDGAWKSEKMAPRFAETIVTQSDRLIRLVGDLLKLAKLEAATTQNDDKSARLSTRSPAHELCERAISAVRPLFEQRQIALELQCDNDILVRGDADLLEQLLINLLANAAHYSPTGSTTTLLAREENGNFVCEVRDEGRGIAAEHLPKLGQRFYRVEEGRQRDSSDVGSGLGLAICRRIALAHGGTLGIESEIGVGTIVTVSLPD